MINCHFLNKHVGSGGGGGAAARFHSSNIFLKFTYRKLKQHGAAPSPLPTHTFWEHLKVKVKNRKLSLKSKLYIFDPLSQQHTHTHWLGFSRFANLPFCLSRPFRKQKRCYVPAESVLPFSMILLVIIYSTYDYWNAILLIIHKGLFLPTGPFWFIELFKPHTRI